MTRHRFGEEEDGVGVLTWAGAYACSVHCDAADYWVCARVVADSKGFSHAAGVGCGVGSPDRVFHLAQSRVRGPNANLRLQAQASGTASH